MKKTKKTILALMFSTGLATVLSTGTVKSALALPLPAPIMQADISNSSTNVIKVRSRHHRHGGRHHGGRHHRSRHRHRHHRGRDVAAGVIAGAIIGGAIAEARRDDDYDDEFYERGVTYRNYGPRHPRHHRHNRRGHYLHSHGDHGYHGHGRR